MKIKLIACEVFARELSFATATSPHVFYTTFMSFGLHDTPDKLRAAIQAEIDACEGQSYDYIVLGYGLCSRGTADIVARSIPLVVPRAHDCITLFLGSRALYTKQFGENPGTYYYSPGWIERKDGEVQQGFIDNAHQQRVDDRYQEYVEKYGEDNAKFLIEQESQWLDHYTRAAFVNTGLGDIPAYRAFTQRIAQDHSWEYSEIEGDMSLVNRLACGDWEGDDFLKVAPGQRIVESFSELVLAAE